MQQQNYARIRYILPKPRIDLYKIILAFSETSVWNTLPVAIKTVGTIGRFKNELHKHLMTDKVILQIIEVVGVGQVG